MDSVSSRNAVDRVADKLHQALILGNARDERLRILNWEDFWRKEFNRVDGRF
jgi:hypothetical protein